MKNALSFQLKPHSLSYNGLIFKLAIAFYCYKVVK